MQFLVDSQRVIYDQSTNTKKRLVRAVGNADFIDYAMPIIHGTDGRLTMDAKDSRGEVYPFDAARDLSIIAVSAREAA